MTNINRKTIIIAPKALLNALRILMLAAPQIDLLAADVSLVNLRKKVNKTPNIALVYLIPLDSRKGVEGLSLAELPDLRNLWPEVQIITIVSNVQQRKEARESGADIVLFEGTTPARLIATIEKVELSHNV